MDKIVYKTFRTEVKEIDEENGIVDMLIPMSTASTDRDGEVIEPNAWKKSLPAFRKRPVLLSSHDYRDLRKQIGEFVKLKITDEGLFAQPKYYINEGNEEADWAFKLASKNKAAYSVGFIPKIWEDGDGDKSPRRTYKENELLEISHVVVPSNRDAIQGLMAKGINDPIVKEIATELLGDSELITKPEETDETIRIPVPGEEGKHSGHRIRTITIDDKKGIKALYCGECKKIITYLFDKDKWTMERARAWVREHKSEGFVSQKEIIDELDYIIRLIESEGLNEEALEDGWKLVREIMRLSGSDIPVDIEEKVGAVLNTKNRNRLNDIRRLAQEVLDSAEEKPKPDEDEEKPKSELTQDEIVAIVKETVKDIIEKAQGRVD